MPIVYSKEAPFAFVLSSLVRCYRFLIQVMIARQENGSKVLFLVSIIIYLILSLFISTLRTCWLKIDKLTSESNCRMGLTRVFCADLSEAKSTSCSGTPP